MAVTENMLLAGLIGGVVLVFLVLISVVFTHTQKEREFTHAERMKALEMGLPMPDDPKTARLKKIYDSMDKTEEKLEKKLEKLEKPPSSSKTLASQCYTTTGWVSGLGFLFAMQAGAPMAYAIAAGAGAVGVTGMICGTILATKEMTFNPSMAMSKPKFDPEAV